MSRHWELEPERVLLECRHCGEITIVLGCEEDWYMDRTILFECQCGQRLTIASEPH
jgi:hypothetical protein